MSIDDSVTHLPGTFRYVTASRFDRMRADFLERTHAPGYRYVAASRLGGFWWALIEHRLITAGNEPLEIAGWAIPGDAWVFGRGEGLYATTSWSRPP